MPSFTFVSTANAFVLRGATPVFVDIRAGHAEHRRDADRGGDHAADAGDRRRSTTPASAARWTRSWRSPRGTACWSIEDAAQGVLADYQGRAARRASATSAALSFHETKNVISRRGRRAARQRPALRRARRDHPREGHQPQPVLPRPGRQVHLGRRRLVVPAERDHRGVPLGADGGGRRDHRRAAWRSGTATTRRFAELEAAGRVRRPDRARAIARTTRTCTTCCCRDLARADGASSSGSRRDGIQPVFHYVPLHSSPFGASPDGRSASSPTPTR